MTDSAPILNEVPLVGWLDERNSFVPRVANISGGIEKAVPESWVPLYGVTRELLEAVIEVATVAEELPHYVAINNDAFSMLTGSIDSIAGRLVDQFLNGGANG